MHRVTAKATAINPMIEKYVPIVAVIMPALKVLLILKVVFELIENALTISKVVNEQARSIAKVDIRPQEGCSTNALAITDRTLLFGIDADRLRVPSAHTVWILSQNLNDSSCVFSGSYNCGAWNVKLGHLIVFTCITDSLRVFDLRLHIVHWNVLFGRLLVTTT